MEQALPLTTLSLKERDKIEWMIIIIEILFFLQSISHMSNQNMILIKVLPEERIGSHSISELSAEILGILNPILMGDILII